MSLPFRGARIPYVCDAPRDSATRSVTLFSLASTVLGKESPKDLQTWVRLCRMNSPPAQVIFG